MNDSLISKRLFKQGYNHFLDFSFWGSQTGVGGNLLVLAVITQSSQETVKVLAWLDIKHFIFTSEYLLLYICSFNLPFYIFYI